MGGMPLHHMYNNKLSTFAFYKGKYASRNGEREREQSEKKKYISAFNFAKDDWC